MIRKCLQLAVVLLTIACAQLQLRAQAEVKIRKVKTVPTVCDPTGTNSNVVLWKIAAPNVGLYVCDTSNTWKLVGTTPFPLALSATSFTATGAAGAGFVALPSQSGAPAAPASGFREFADATGRVAWLRASDGFTRTFDSTLTGNRVYTLPNANSTFPIVSQQLTFAGPTAPRTITLPDADFTAARTDAANTFTGTQTVGQIRASDGNAAAPGVSFSGTTAGATGMYRASQFELDFGIEGVGYLAIASPHLRIASGAYFGWTNGGIGNSTDVNFNREGAGIARVGTTTTNSAGSIRALTYLTDTNCADSAGAAACGSATAGNFVLDAAATTVVISTTNVTATSQIFIQEDSSLGTRLSVTCNVTTGRIFTVSARTAATSFTVTSSAAPVTNPACLSYRIVN